MTMLLLAVAAIAGTAAIVAALWAKDNPLCCPRCGIPFVTWFCMTCGKK